MTSSSTTNSFNYFDQDNYDNTFYYCDNDHAFIAFTTCYCPLCDLTEEAQGLDKELCEAINNYEELAEIHEKIVLLAHKIAPEVLL